MDDDHGQREPVAEHRAVRIDGVQGRTGAQCEVTAWERRRGAVHRGHREHAVGGARRADHVAVPAGVTG